MSYAALIKSNVRKAFSAVGDIKTIVTLSQKATASFDFSTGLATTGDSTTKIVECIVVTRMKESTRTRGAQTQQLSMDSQMQLLFKADDIDAVTVFDTVTIPDGKVWGLILPFETNGYLVTATVSKGT
jgi:hypothetical protein